MVHDPHPDGGGLLTQDYYVLLLPLRPVLKPELATVEDNVLIEELSRRDTCQRQGICSYCLRPGRDEFCRARGRHEAARGYTSEELFTDSG